MQDLPIADIRTDGETQQRPIEDKLVARYQALMDDGTKFPPIQVVYDGSDYWLWDGFHRLHAHMKLGNNYISAEVSEGTKREALWHSFSANKNHGQPRADNTVKNMLLTKILPDEQWSQETNEGLAEWLGTTSKYVQKIRRLFSKEEKERAEASADPKPNPKLKDSQGVEVPDNLYPIFNRKPEILGHIKTIAAEINKVKDAVRKNDKLYVNCKYDQLKSHFNNLRTNLRFAMPYVVCPMCGGDENNDECGICKGHGFLNERQYIALPVEMKGE